jgi:hypothetical protein
MTATPEQRLMLVHAHPDDESINNGVTMAKYVDQGRGVTLVTAPPASSARSWCQASNTSPPTGRTAWGSTAAASWTMRWPRSA